MNEVCIVTIKPPFYLFNNNIAQLKHAIKENKPKINVPPVNAPKTA